MYFMLIRRSLTRPALLWWTGSGNVSKCDVIKQNELELANTVFKIQPNKADSFFCFLLFVQSFNCLYLWNQLPNLCGVFTKLKPQQYPNRKCQKNQKSYFFDFRLILLYRITNTKLILKPIAGYCKIDWSNWIICHLIFVRHKNLNFH